eukprot:1724064-Amphidinium_carterae.2
MQGAQDDEPSAWRARRTFQPGAVGVQISWPFVVKVIPESQAANASVRSGWRICNINDEDCTEELFQTCVAGDNAYSVVFHCTEPARDMKRPMSPRSSTPPRALELPERTWSIATPTELSPCPGGKTRAEDDYEDWEKCLESFSLAITSRDRAANLKACLMRASVPKMLALPF